VPVVRTADGGPRGGAGGVGDPAGAREPRQAVRGAATAAGAGTTRRDRMTTGGAGAGLQGHVCPPSSASSGPRFSTSTGSTRIPGATHPRPRIP
jgi:hypothetical protein